MKEIILQVPLLNANEPEARLAEILVRDGQFVKHGDLLFSLETTKATAEIESPADGYITVMGVENQNYLVGDVLALITEEKIVVKNGDSVKESKEAKEELRITEPARILATKIGLEFDLLPRNRLVTESMIKAISNANKFDLPKSIKIDSERSLIVYGAGGHAKTVLELISVLNDFDIIGMIDDNIPAGTQVMGFPVLGSQLILKSISETGIKIAANGVGGISDFGSRGKVFSILERENYSIPKLIHPAAYVEKSSSIGNCVQIFANAYVGSEVSLGAYCMINTNAVISHDCVIGAYTHIAPGALLAGQVMVGDRTLIGMGVKTAIGIEIGDNVRVGNGAILNADVPAGFIIPSGKVWQGVDKQ